VEEAKEDQQAAPEAVCVSVLSNGLFGVGGKETVS